MSTNALAVRFIIRNAPTEDAVAEILAILDLLDEAGSIRPDPSPVRLEMPLPKAQVSVVSQQAASQDIRLRPKHSTAPEALRNLAPIPVAEPAKPVAKPRSAAQQVGPPQASNQARMAPCGTETAAKRHKRNGEIDGNGDVTCAECQAGRDKRRQVAKPVRRQAVTAGSRCGTRQGYDDHMARGENTCTPCKQAISAYARGRYQERKGQPLKPPTVHPQCGKPGGRAVHRRRNEQSCDPCRMARNAHEREKATA